MNSIPIPEPSLSSRAVLCSLSISMWSARKHDPGASEEIEQRHGAQPDAGRYHGADRGERQKQILRGVYPERTRARFLAALGMTKLGTQQFGQLVGEARVRLGGLFRSEDYPAPEELRSKFSFETKVMPLPGSGSI